MDHIRFEPTSNGDQLQEHAAELLSALDHIFLSVVKLELDTGRAWLLQSRGQQDRRPYDFDWDTYIRFYQSVLEPEQAEKLAQQAHERCPVSKLLTGRGHAAIVAEPWEDD